MFSSSNAFFARPTGHKSAGFFSDVIEPDIWSGMIKPVLGNPVSKNIIGNKFLKILYFCMPGTSTCISVYLANKWVSSTRKRHRRGQMTRNIITRDKKYFVLTFFFSRKARPIINVSISRRSLISKHSWGEKGFKSF